MISRFLNLSNDFSQGVTVHSYLVPVTDFADASHSKSAKSAATTVSYGIFSSENACLWTVTTRFHISSALKAVYGKGNPMITGHLGSSFYTFLTKCLISHGYRLFKCCFKCSEQCFQITLNFQTKKSMNWRMHLWMHFLLWWKYDCRLHKGWTLTTE